MTYLSHLLLVTSSSSNIVIYCWKVGNISYRALSKHPIQHFLFDICVINIIWSHNVKVSSCYNIKKIPNTHCNKQRPRWKKHPPTENICAILNSQMPRTTSSGLFCSPCWDVQSLVVWSSLPSILSMETQWQLQPQQQRSVRVQVSAVFMILL